MFSLSQPNQVHCLFILRKACLVSQPSCILIIVSLELISGFLEFCRNMGLCVLLRSGLEQEDMRTLYKYLVSSLFPSTINLEVQNIKFL